MKGKNVRTPEQQEQLQKALFPILEGVVQLIFPDGKIKYDELVGEKVLKIHVNELHSDDILALAEIAKDKKHDVIIKRSGTGVTILVGIKRVGEISKS